VRRDFGVGSPDKEGAGEGEGKGEGEDGGGNGEISILDSDILHKFKRLSESEGLKLYHSFCTLARSFASLFLIP
jgi:hypothetical protein